MLPVFILNKIINETFVLFPWLRFQSVGDLFRFRKFLLYFGYSHTDAGDVNVGLFCKTLSDFALEYRTTRERVIYQRQKKATQRQRNMTRGKMIVEVRLLRRVFLSCAFYTNEGCGLQ